MSASNPIPEPPRDDPGQLLEPRFKFPRVNEITGTFVLVIVALLIAAGVWTGRSQRWFKSNVTLRITLPEAGAAGIRQGSEIYFLGTLVGTVSDVVADETGRMEAEGRIRRDFFRFVRADSSAVVKKKFGVAGDSFFEITRGTGPPLSDKNASIVCKEQFQSALEAAVEQVRSEVMLLLKKTSTGLEAWTKLGLDLGETRQRLHQLTISLENMATGVEQGKGSAGKFITETALADGMQQLLTRANATMTDLQGVVTNLNIAVENVRDGTVRLPEITGAVADEAKDLSGLVHQTQSSMRELERLIEAVQRHWLLRRYVDQTNPPPLDPLPRNIEPEKNPSPPLRSPKRFRD